MLCEKAGAGLQVFGLLDFACLDSDGGADRIAIALLSAQAEGDGAADAGEIVVQDAHLGRVAILQDDFEAAVVIDVGESEAIGCLRVKSRPEGPEISEKVPSRLLANSTLRA